MRRFRAFGAGIAALAAALVAGCVSEYPAGGKTADLGYAAWVGFKPGAAVHYEWTWSDQPPERVRRDTRTLSEISAESAAVVEARHTSTAGQPGPAAVEKVMLVYPARDAHAEAGSRPLNEGKAQIEAAGRTFSCHWKEWTETDEKGTHRVTCWYSPEVPGGVVKVIISTRRVDGDIVTSQMTLTAFDARK